MRERLRERHPALHAERQRADQLAGVRPELLGQRVRRRPPPGPEDRGRELQVLRRRSGRRTGRGPAARSRAGGGSAATAARRTARPRPSLAGIRPSSIRISVVLPAPFAPSRPTISPGPTIRSTSLTAVKLPEPPGRRAHCAAGERSQRAHAAPPAGCCARCAATITASCRSGGDRARRRPAGPGSQTRHWPARRHDLAAASPGGLAATARSDPGIAATISSGVPDGQRRPGVEHEHRRAPLGLVQVRRRQHDRAALGGRARDQPPQARPADRVDSGRRLVEDEQLRLVQHGGDHGELLPHPAGQLPGEPAGGRRQARPGPGTRPPAPARPWRTSRSPWRGSPGSRPRSDRGRSRSWPAGSRSAPWPGARRCRCPAPAPRPGSAAAWSCRRRLRRRPRSPGRPGPTASRRRGRRSSRRPR